MTNMSYCRFENTANDLEDCFDNWNEDDDLSESEKEAKEKIVYLAQEIVALNTLEF